MAWNFNGTSQYVTLADVASNDIPSGDWSFLFRVKRSGTGLDNIYFAEGASGVFFVLYFESDNTVAWLAQDDAANFEGVGFSTAISDTNWHTIVLVKSGTTLSLYVDNTLSDSSTVTFGACTFNTTTFFGSNSTPATFFAGDMAEAAFFARAITSGERGDYESGVSPTYFTATSRRWYVPMYSSDYTEKWNSITVTNNGTTAATHPPMGTWSGVVNEASIFGGAGTLNSGTLAVVGELSVFGGSSTLNANTIPTINEISIFGGSSVLAGGWLPAVNEASVFGGSGILNSDTLGVVNETSVFGGSGTLNSSTLAVINEVSVFGGTVSLLINYTASVSEISVFGGTAIVTKDFVPTINEISIFTGSSVLSAFWELVTPNSATDFTLVSTNSDTDFTLVSVNSDSDFTLVS